MNKAEMEKKIKGLEGLVEAQRETIKKLAPASKEKKEYFIRLVTGENEEVNFYQELDNNEAQLIKDFIKRINHFPFAFYISIYEKANTDEGDDTI